MCNLKSISLHGNGTKRIIECPILQSPLAGVSDQTFRKLVRKWAPKALLYTEMVNAKSLELGFGVNKIHELSEEEGPIAVQLFDSKINSLIDAAKRAEQCGAYLIDINMGCPARKITKKGGGSKLLLKENLAAEIVNKVVNSVSIPVTVKTRLGWCDQTSNPIFFSSLIQSAGAQMITIHGRTRKQGFSGKADWEKIGQIKKALTIPVIANGDINSVANAKDCLKISKADGLMIGRGTMGSPWLVGQLYSFFNGGKLIDDPSPKEKLNIALEQLNDLIKLKGEHGFLIAKKHLNWTCRGFKDSSVFRKKLVTAKTSIEAIHLIKEKIDFLN